MQRIKVVDGNGLTAFSNPETHEVVVYVAKLLSALLDSGVCVNVNGVEFDGTHSPYEVSIENG